VEVFQGTREESSDCAAHRWVTSAGVIPTRGESLLPQAQMLRESVLMGIHSHLWHHFWGFFLLSLLYCMPALSLNQSLLILWYSYSRDGHCQCLACLTLSTWIHV